MRKLQETCQYAYAHVPYYTKLFQDAGFNPSQLRYFDDLEKIPYLTKNIIQEHIDELVSTAIPKKELRYSTTGGSTGIPMGMYETPFVAIKEDAYIAHMWQRMGYSFHAKLAVLRGTYTGEKGLFYQHRERGREVLLLSSYHMTEETLPQYIAVLRKFKPEFMHVYASAIFILCDYMKQNHIEPFPSLKAVLVGSENVYPHQRALVEEVLHCRLFSHYGHSERACLAGECEKSTDYHIFWQYGYTELLNANGQPVSKEGEPGEIVATTFDHFGMPLIRYKTMDIAENTLRTCECGRNYKLISRVKGRLQEVLVTKSGRYISMAAINMHSDVFDHVAQFQFYQDNPDFCIFNVIRKADYTQADEQNIYHELKKKLGEELDLQIRYVEEIPRTPSGKYRFLIQKLPILFTEEIYND